MTTTPQDMSATSSTGANVKVKIVESPGSEYVILIHKTGMDTKMGVWIADPEHVTGRSADHAIRQHAAAKGNQAGTYVAVPAKSWKPLVVRTETVTTLKLDTPKPDDA